MLPQTLLPLILCIAAAFAADDSALKVKWDVSPFADGFQSVKNLNEDNFLIDFCEQTPNGKKQHPFLGRAYTAKSDRYVVVLYDVQGSLAGMQSWVPDNKGWVPPKKLGSKFFIHVNGSTDIGHGWFVQTAYFMDPTKICNGGRKEAKTADGLWLQNGPNPMTDFLHPPNKDQSLASNNPWANTGKCFYTMGQHYWYNVHKNMDCEDFVPYCLLYNNGQLNAFCFALNAELTDDYFDSPHPTPKVLSQFMSDVPSCMNANNPRFNHYSTIHVFFSNHPRLNFCD